jgi:hypothetical protein
MIRNISLFVFILIGTTILSQVKDWENPEITGINKLPPHTFSIPYHSEEAALIDVWEKSEFFRSLNGLWKFHWPQIPTADPWISIKLNMIFQTGMILKSLQTGRCRALVYLYIPT